MVRSINAGRRIRRLIILAVIAVFLIGLGVSFFWVYDRGLKREGLFERAQRALYQKRYDDALRLAEQALQAEPKHPYVRDLILETLIDADRLPEAKQRAEQYLSEDPDRDFAARRLCFLSLQEGDVDAAERYARTLADQDPEYAYRVLALVEDHRGLVTNNWGKRLEAAATMRNLATLADSDSAKAESLLYAASVCLEVAPCLPQGDVLRERARNDLSEAVTYINAARTSNKSYPYDLAMGRVRSLSENEEEASLGAETLHPYTQGALYSSAAVMELVKYHIAREHWSEAVALVRELKDAYLWHRIFWGLRRADRVNEALEILACGPMAGRPEGEVLKGELLLRSSDLTRREEGRRVLTRLCADPKTATTLVLRSLILLAINLDLDTARQIAEETGVQGRKDPRILAFLATLLSASEDEKAKGLELAEQLAAQTDSVVESGDLVRLLGGSGGEAFDSYVEVQVNKGGETGLQHRLTRAMAMLARAKKEEPGAASNALRERVVADLTELRDDPAATKAALAVAFNLASSVGEVELAGELLGRALPMVGEPGFLDARIFRLALDLDDDGLRKQLADGIRAAADRVGSRTYLTTIADLIARRENDLAVIQQAFEDAAQDSGSAAPSLELASRVAYGRGNFAIAEGLARRSAELEPERVGALELLGAALLRRGAYDDVLALYAHKDPTPGIAFPQIVAAYLQLGRKEEAITKAREAVRLFPNQTSSHLLLARLYVDLGEPRKALSVLNLAPADEFVTHMRAELLRQCGDTVMAERLYQVLLAHSKFADVRAWQGLMQTLSEQKRTKEFVMLCGRALGSSYLADHADVRGMLYYMRGTCLEREGKIEEALADYEASIREDDSRWIALNNAAWHIAKTSPARIDTARMYIDRALKLQPEAASIMDTAAEVYSIQNDTEGALRLIDQALALKPEGKTRNYLVHKAEILLRGGREDEAKALLEQVRAESADDAAARKARDLLWAIERRHMPDEEPARLPVLPEDEEEPGAREGE